MAGVMKKYPIGGNYFTHGVLEGFTWLLDESMTTSFGGQRHICFIGPVDGGRGSCPWGRLRFQMTLEGEAVPLIRAFATDDTELVVNGQVRTYESVLLDKELAADKKLTLFEAAGASKFLGKDDILLYAQNGRYLWICLEVVGLGTAKLRDLEVFAPRDNFFNTFPEIYRRDGDFFHRYLSIFSSLYYDLQDTIDSLDTFLDVDTAPAAALPIFAGWLGLELDGGFLDEEHLRKLLRAAFGLMREKGTRRAVEGILRVFIDEPFYIVEQRVASSHMTGQDRPVCERLYGRSPFDCTILMNRPANERLHAQLRFLLRQFVLLRCRINLIFLDPVSRMDGYVYLDVNACVTGTSPGSLDSGRTMGGVTALL